MNKIKNHFENIQQIKYLNKLSGISRINELRNNGMDSFINSCFHAEISNSEKWKY